MTKNSNLAAPTKREIIAELKGEIEGWRNGYREADGVIRDKDALHSIRCLEAAIQIVRKAKHVGGD